MRALTCILALGCVAISWSVASGDDELKQHNEVFHRWWGSDLELKLDKLPTQGTVAEDRMPYSGYYYPDTRGGVSNALRKYDMAFNGRRLKATAFEQWDTTAFTEPTQVERRAGLFGRRIIMETTIATPSWHGHCNGWSAATIRHSEPTKNVVQNGVTFTPADIKALLCELYMYTNYEELEGSSALVDAAGLHITLANWLGVKTHPIAMESDPGKEKWNFPVYGYESTVTKRGDKQVDVRTKLLYMYYSNGEYQQSPRNKRYKSFHYALNLDAEGKITNGFFYNDSARIDLLWVPLYPAKGGTKANSRGNPHIDVEAVLALWRKSVSDDAIAHWTNIDPKGESLLPPAPAPQIAEGANNAPVAPAAHTEPAATPTPTPAPEQPGTASSNSTTPSTTTTEGNTPPSGNGSAPSTPSAPNN